MSRRRGKHYGVPFFNLSRNFKDQFLTSQTGYSQMETSTGSFRLGALRRCRRESTSNADARTAAALVDKWTASFISTCFPSTQRRGRNSRIIVSLFYFRRPSRRSENFFSLSLAAFALAPPFFFFFSPLFNSRRTRRIKTCACIYWLKELCRRRDGGIANKVKVNKWGISQHWLAALNI